MGLVLQATVYISSYLFLLFVAVCLACGLYYLAELAEEHTSTMKRCIGVSIAFVLGVHVLFLLFEQLPTTPLLVSLAAHVVYGWLLQSFPYLRPCSPPFLAALAMLVASNYAWARHFIAHYHQLTHVLCFLLLNVWMVPVFFFISLTINESTLPERNALAGSAADVYSEGGSRSRQKNGLLSAFSFMQNARDGYMPAISKKV